MRGVDISRRMVETTRSHSDDAAIDCVHCALEDFAIAPTTYDLEVSHMTLHYVRDDSALAHAVTAGLPPGGRFVLSVEHPMCTVLCCGWHGNAQGEADL